MRTFLAIVIIITMHHFKISDPTTPWIVQAMLFVGFFTAIAQDVNEFRRR